jgi:hypothetical protein
MLLPSDTELSFSFSTVTVLDMNAKVSAGEHLGISISGVDFAPYCHLEYDTKAFAGW